MTLRLIHSALAAVEGTTFDDRRVPIQLSLFDFKPKIRVLCLAMSDLHGHTFLRALRQYRPQTVFDVRSHPYFDLHALGREAAFAAFHDASSVYCHRPLNLRPVAGQSDRWRMMREAATLFSDVAPVDSDASIFAVLHHREEERGFIEGALFQVGREQLDWELVAP